MTQPKLYLFSVVAVDRHSQQNHIVSYLLIDTSPQSAKEYGLKDMNLKYPGCHCEIGRIDEISQNMIKDIKRLL